MNVSCVTVSLPAQVFQSTGYVGLPERLPSSTQRIYEIVTIVAVHIHRLMVCSRLSPSTNKLKACTFIARRVPVQTISHLSQLINYSIHICAMNYNSGYPKTNLFIWITARGGLNSIDNSSQIIFCTLEINYTLQ